MKEAGRQGPCQSPGMLSLLERWAWPNPRTFPCSPVPLASFLLLWQDAQEKQMKERPVWAHGFLALDPGQSRNHNIRCGWWERVPASLQPGGKDREQKPGTRCVSYEGFPWGHTSPNRRHPPLEFPRPPKSLFHFKPSMDKIIDYVRASWPNYFPKAPPLNIDALETTFNTLEFGWEVGEVFQTQSISARILEKTVEKCSLEVIEYRGGRAIYLCPS